MAENQTESGDRGDGRAERSPWVGLLQAAGARLVPLVISAGALLGFVAFAGAVIVWTRFFAVKVPPDQVVTAVPRDELVATGSSLLLLFGFFGALAVLATYLIDRGGRATPGMSRGLLALLAVEGVTAIMIDAGELDGDALLAISIYIAPLLMVLAATLLDRFTSVEDALQAREREREDPRPRPLYYVKKDGLLREEERLVKGRDLWLMPCLVVVLVIAMALLALALPEAIEIAGRVAVALSLAVCAVWSWRAYDGIKGKLTRKWKASDDRERRLARREKAEAQTRKQEIAAAERAVRRARQELRSVREREAGTIPAGESKGATPAEERAEHMLRACKAEARALREDDEAREGGGRRNKPRSYKLQFKVQGMILAALAAGAAAWFPFLVLHELWVVVALAAAALLALGLWRIAALSKRGFLWFGLAVFLSVPLFGTLTLMARNLDDPQVQPVALIRSTDGPDEAIQGLYVTEGSDRVYFATVATEGCTDKLRGGSGRLLWVPKSEVVAMSVGPLQSVTDAARTSLEMAYALTPAVETPSGTAVSLRAEAEEAEAETLAEGGSKRAPRLENTGPAVRPTFGRGLRLEPESASPNDVVRLRISTPNEDEDVNGFGEAREGKTLRVGGVPAAIVKDTANRAQRAEFAKTVEGKVLALDKQGPYGRSGGEYEPIEPGAKGAAYVRLGERSGVEGSVDPSGKPIPPGEDGGVYLELDRSGRSRGEPDRLVARQEVRFSRGKPVEVARPLLRQAWGESEIRFRVPENASTGVVAVECEQLAGQPLLLVERPPEVRLAAQMSGPGRIALDSRRSRDEGKIELRRWLVDGRPRFRSKRRGKRVPRGKTKVEFGVSRRLAIHRIQFTAVDDQDEAGTASIYLLRVPHPGIAFYARRSERPAVLDRLRRSLVRLMNGEAPEAIVVDAHARDESGGKGASKSFEAAERLVGKLLSRRAAREAGFGGEGVSVTIRAFGENCGFVGRDSPHGRHVDLFVLSEGVRLAFPRGCGVRRVRHCVWGAGEFPESRDKKAKQERERRRKKGGKRAAASCPAAV